MHNYSKAYCKRVHFYIII